jgi:mannose-6-phosphate isomerase-like protein (cupin superfamily)
MRFSARSTAKKFVASRECTVWEYQLGSSKVNGSVAEVNGRYPTKGWAVNEECDELVYVISGSGKILMPDKETDIQPGDTAIIEAGEKFAWQGDELAIFIPCMPAWRPEQHKVIDE